MKKLLLLLFIFKTVYAEPTPIVLWHGMGDSCCYAYSLGGFKRFLEEKIPGVYVHSLKIGDTVVEDFENGYFMNPNEQVEYVCKVLASDPNLKNGFHAIGFSQGCQFFRGVIERCGHKIPKVKNFISLGGQHQGVYGIPNCAAFQYSTCDYIRKLLNYAAYTGFVQHNLVQATYWHDPLDEMKYRANSDFLSDINNEIKINKTYARNLNKLDNMVLVKFANDSIVQPKETEWFGFYAPGQDKLVLPLKQTRIYLKDRIGLRLLDKRGRLKFLLSPGNHLHFNEDWFMAKILKPYLL